MRKSATAFFSAVIFNFTRLQTADTFSTQLKNMRKFIPLAITFLLSQIIWAQPNDKLVEKFYFSAATGGSSDNGVTAGITATVIFKNNWTVGVGYQYMEVSPKNIPADYEPGYVFFIPIPMPVIKMNTVNVTAGKLLPVSTKTWFTTEGGVSIISTEQMQFRKVARGSVIIGAGSNYETSTAPANTIGCALNVEFNWAFAKFIGAGVGAFGNINSEKSAIGGQLKLIVGNLRK